MKIIKIPKSKKFNQKTPKRKKGQTKKTKRKLEKKNQKIKQMKIKKKRIANDKSLVKMNILVNTVMGAAQNPGVNIIKGTPHP